MNIKPSVIKEALLPKVSTITSSLNDEGIVQSFNVDLFNISGITRNVRYSYATINNSGNISFHNAYPLRMVDNTQSNANYRNRTTWLSVNTDSVADKNKKDVYYNSNHALMKIFASTEVKDITGTKPNPYNCVTVANARLRNLLVPSSITPTEEEMRIIQQPVRVLATEVRSVAESQLDDDEKAEAYKASFIKYTDALIKLINEAGLLMYTTGIITPEQSSLNISIKLEDSLTIKSNPWLNASEFLANPTVHMNAIPTINSFHGLVEIIESDDIENLLYSDNAQMLGRKELSRSGESVRYALSKIAVIKDYASDITIVVSLLDTMNNGRSRVEALEGLIAKGQRTFLIDGVLSPVVRLINSDASRNGNVFYELKINRYVAHNSNNIRRSVESDDYDFGDFETVSVGNTESLYGDKETVETKTQDNDDPMNDFV